MGSKIKKITKSKIFLLGILAIVVFIAICLIKPAFLAKGNIRTICNELVIISIMICGVVPLMVGGGIDLAASAEAAVGTMVFANLLANTGMGWGIALVITLLVGAFMGWLLVAFNKYLHIFPFIASLGLSSIYTGFMSMWSRSNDVMIQNESFIGINKVTILGGYIPILFVFAAVLCILYGLAMKYTKFGRKIYMVGGNQTAARLAGIDPSSVQEKLFINSSIMSVLAGLTWACRNKFGTPSKLQTLAPNFDAITAAVLGGVAFRGGDGSIGGAFVAMLLVRIFRNGVVMMGAQSFVTYLMQGGILLVALVLDNISKKRVEKKRQAAAMAAAG